MSGNLPSGVTDADIDRAIQDDDDLPCKWESFSGICMRCGAGPDEECVVERERTRVENNRINDALGGFDSYALGYYVNPNQ